MAATERAPVASVVIPAHDEEQVIERCLRRLLDGAEPGELEVVVVANGCRDATAARARAAAPAAKVLDLPVASKVAALRAGDEVATTLPRAYLDADIEMSADDLRLVLAVLDEGRIHCAAPAMELELAGRPWFVRAFFRAFGDLPYLADGLVGNGVYVLSAEGRGRFAQFPDLTADDLYVRNLFTAAERAVVPGARFRVHPPRTLRGLLAIRERAYRGNQEYAARGYVSVAEPTLDRRRLLGTLRHRPLDTAVFLAVNLAAKVRLRARRRPGGWERDDSGRR